jgi:hypothetical protein
VNYKTDVLLRAPSANASAQLGKERGMKPEQDAFVKIQVALLLILFLLLRLNQEAGKLREFSPDGKVKVLMPGKPETEGCRNCWSVENRDWCCAVTFDELPPWALADPDAILEGRVQGFMADNDAKITNSTKITLAGRFPGRAFEGYAGRQDAFIKGRAYLVEDRFYMVFAKSREWAKLDSADVTKVLDSFELISAQ